MLTRLLRNNAVFIVALLVVVVVGLGVRWYRARRRREPFFPLIPLLGLGLTAAGVGAKVTGVDQKVQQKIWGPGGPTGGGQPAAPAVKPTYVGRQFDGYDWSCPTGTVETGWENDKACISSQFHPPAWKAGPDGKWAWLCPNGTVPTPEETWEKKCEVGWTSRVFSDGKWQCPEGTTDSGKTWDNAPYHEALKQCKRSQPYTFRINKDGKWVCPEGTKDTGLSWDSKEHQTKQCKWIGP